jgi:hypothetical protein
VPTQFHKESFERSGVRSEVVVIPEPVDTDYYDPAKHVAAEGIKERPGQFLFLSIFKVWSLFTIFFCQLHSFIIDFFVCLYLFPDVLVGGKERLEDSGRIIPARIHARGRCCAVHRHTLARRERTTEGNERFYQVIDR